MVTLKIDNSISRIEGLDKQLFDKLRQVLSYSKDPTTQYMYGSYNARYYLLNLKGFFPTGLLTRVINFLEKNLVVYSPESLHRMPNRGKDLFTINLGHVVPYQEQLEIATQPAYHKHRGTISACTGFGKSVAMALLVNFLQLRTLIIVPNLVLKQQLTESFKKWFGITSAISIENIDSAELPNMIDYYVLIIDEAHHVAAKTYRDLNKKAWNKIYYRYFFTATPYRSKSEEQILFEALAGGIIYEIGYKAAVKKGYVCPVTALNVELPKIVPKGNTSSWPSMYNELVVNNEHRNTLISLLLLKLKPESPVLCLVKEIKHGEILSQMTDIPFVSGHSNNKHLIDDFNVGRIRCLIGTSGVLGEGVDTKAAEFIIVAGLGRSKPQFMQMVGRGIRKYPGKDSCKVIIFKDPSHKWTLVHFKEQCKILKDEYGVVPEKIILD
jgi:superfamily II DNA or RNA helicase